jgi:hypothetical protein
MTNYNCDMPLLHRPTFEDAISKDLHLHDLSFGSVVLLVCALASRHVDDSRVLLPGGTRRSAGWRWFNEVDISRRDLLRPPRLYDIQAYVLAAWFSSLVYRTQLAWTLIGIAIRLLAQVGAHMKRVYKATPNAHDELWKRCFWYANSCSFFSFVFLPSLIALGWSSYPTWSGLQKRVDLVDGQQTSESNKSYLHSLLTSCLL